MNFTKIIIKALSLEGVKDFFTVLDEDDNLDSSQIIGSIIQLLIFTILIVTIGIFLT
jgi:hypothetical protein